MRSDTHVRSSPTILTRWGISRHRKKNMRAGGREGLRPALPPHETHTTIARYSQCVYISRERAGVFAQTTKPTVGGNRKWASKIAESGGNQISSFF